MNAEQIVIVGSAEEIRDFLCGPQDHNAHCKGWRWEKFLAEMQIRERQASVNAAARQIISEAYERRGLMVEYREAAE